MLNALLQIYLVNRLVHTSSVGLLTLNRQRHLMLNFSSFKKYGTAEKCLHKVQPKPQFHTWFIQYQAMKYEAENAKTNTSKCGIRKDSNGIYQ